MLFSQAGFILFSLIRYGISSTSSSLKENIADPELNTDKDITYAQIEMPAMASITPSWIAQSVSLKRPKEVMPFKRKSAIMQIPVMEDGSVVSSPYNDK